MKKRLVAAAMACAVAGSLGLFGCSSGSDAPAKEEAGGGETQPAQKEEAPAAKYAVSIDDCATTSDYQGNPALVVTYTWTNNSDDDAMFSVAIRDKVFQNGVELDFAVISSSDGSFDTGASMKDIKPGATQTVQKAYLLEDQSDVTIECEESFSFSDELLAEQTFSLA